jgi:hypothetical protein
MPTDLSISTVTASQPSLTARPASAAAPQAASQAAEAPAFPQPVGHLDAALGIEVMQFVDQSGGVTQSFPSPRQLEAYRDAPATVPAPGAGSTQSV